MNAAVARQHEAWDEARGELRASLVSLRAMLGDEDLWSLIEEVVSVKGYRDCMSDLKRMAELQTGVR